MKIFSATCLALPNPDLQHAAAQPPPGRITASSGCLLKNEYIRQYVKTISDLMRYV